MKINLSDLEKSINYTFKNRKLLQQATVHRSYLNENKSLNLQSNERLEFLGDAVLSLIVSDFIYLQNKNYTEGELTNLRSLIVRTKTLATAAKSLKLGKFLQLSKGETNIGGRENETILANSYEALLGAIYLDSDISASSKFVKQTLLNILNKITSNGDLYDYKSQLQHKIQEDFHKLPIYKLIAESGPDHAKLFKVGVYINDKLIGAGIGKNKQEAEQQAAKKALESAKLK